MRQSLIPGGLEVIAYNINRQVSSLRIFEYGSVYSRLPEKSGETLEGYEEHTNYLMMVTGTPEKPKKPLDVSRTTHNADEMNRVYQQGRDEALQRLEELKQFLAQSADDNNK